ncbi:MAG: porphobilinogen synthase, partial [Nitrospirae bacterium]|nr:porphobilinogen synthase [Nitrospirota bacterium]
MTYPVHRPRRLRKSEEIRVLVKETRLEPDQFIYPLFVTYGKAIRSGISSMPGHYRFSVDQILPEIEEIISLGVRSVILFGIPEKKDDFGSEAYNPNGIVQTAVRKIKQKFPQLLVITDVCIDEYTSHGHCGVVLNGEIQNDETLPLLAKMALTHVESGADMVAPSDMMDGRIGFIRKFLDQAGKTGTPILAYSAKYASCFYGPFREAAQSAPSFGDRKTYQMDPANSREALREVAFDIKEGADIIMVKPAMPYLDIIYQIKKKFEVPVAA